MLNSLLKRLHHNDRGASMVEYSLLVVLIAIAGFLAVSYFGDSVSGTFSTIADSLTNSGG
jgi:Flp pilus assembly pilin Flp